MKQQASDRLAATLAHHIRSPLATALLYMHLIDRELGSGINQELRDGLASAREEMLRVNRLLGNLVDYHRLGRVVIQPALIDAGPVISEAIAKTVLATAAEIKLDLPAQDLVDWWDGGALEEIVQSLLSNSIQHRRPPISIAVDRVGPGLQVVVRDGGGMSSRELARVFRQRLTDPGDRSSSIDLGMWLTTQLVTAHGGEVVGEVGPDGGTVVTVTLAPSQPRT